MPGWVYLHTAVLSVIVLVVSDLVDGVYIRTYEYFLFQNNLVNVMVTTILWICRKFYFLSISWSCDNSNSHRGASTYTQKVAGSQILPLQLAYNSNYLQLTKT